MLREPVSRAPLEGLHRRKSTFDWDYFEEALFRARVVPAAASALASEPWLLSVVPERLVARIRDEAEKTAARNIFKEKELASVTAAFRSEEIPQIVLKGLPFGERFYGNSSLREVRDLDILVPPERLERSERVLVDLGYVLFEGVHSRAYYRKHHFHVVYVRRGLGIDVVELHWNLLPHPGNIALDTAPLFRDRREYEYRGSKLHVLSPADEFAYLCASLRAGLFVSLKRLLDLERISRSVRYEAPPSDAVRRGTEWGIGDEVLTSLYLLGKFWGEPAAGVRFPRTVERFASRIGGSDFFGLSSGREIRLRIWSGYRFTRTPRGKFVRRLLWQDEDFRAKMFFDEEESPPLKTRLRRFLSGLALLLDLGWNLVLSGVRRRS
jgi:hypothetical protein